MRKMKHAEGIAEMLRQGKVVVCPTDTVYGLVADATNKKAVQKVFRIKGRTKRKPLPIFVKSISMAKTLAEISPSQETFLRKVWPGKVTVILQRKKSPFTLYGVDKKTIALRIPDHKVIGFLVSALGSPLTGTSANISGKPSTGKIQEVISQFKHQKVQPDFVLNAGDLKPSKSSRIIDLTHANPRILRD